MVAEVLEHLAPSRGGVFVDCTVGLGGHARALVEAGASRVIGLDRDQQALDHARETLRDAGERSGSRARRLSRVRRGAGRKGHRTRRRAVGGSGRVVAAARRARPRIQLQARRAARHAHGHIEWGDRGRDAGLSRREDAGGRDLRAGRRASRAARGASDCRRPERHGGSSRRGSWPTS